MKDFAIPFLDVDTEVIYSGAASPSYRHRLGRIVEVDKQAGRYRVRWTHESADRLIMKNGKPQPTRTWVAFHTVTVKV